VNRREFITMLCGAAASWPLTLRAQQPERMRRVGALIAFGGQDPLGQAAAAALRRGLEQFGWVEGRNIKVDYRFAAGDAERYKAYAAELVGLSPDAILASAAPSVEALHPLTRTIPIVFVLVADPVGLGFVQSLARPGGNITGFSVYDAQLMGKWLGLLNRIAPSVKRIAVIFNPDTAPFANLFNRSIETAAQSLGITVTLDPVHDDATIEEAVSAQARQPGGGVVVLPESFSVTHRKTIIAAASRNNLPAVGMGDLFPRDGGLMSYWIDTIDQYSQAASYIDRILKGALPGNLPVQEPTKFSLILNLTTAKTLGLTIPPDVLALADEVIE
jgi:putative tryptophan/tyrosine transport system substrate-binding protein